MPVFNTLHPILWTEQFDESIRFYTNVLGFSLKEKNDGWQWALLEKDHIRIMLSKPNAHEKSRKIGFTGSFYFNVNNVVRLWEDLKDKVKVCYEIETFEWGMKEFAIYDNSGYLLQFGQPVDEISVEG